MTTNLEKAQSKLREAESRWDAATAEKKALNERIDAQTEPLRTTIDAKKSEINKLYSEVSKLEVELSEQRSEFDEELHALTKAQNAAHSDELNAQMDINVALFELAQEQLDESSIIASDAMVAELNALIKSRREISSTRTLGSQILLTMERMQRSGGLQRHHLNHVRTRDVWDKRVDLTNPQADRCWEYLSEVCIVRRDGGLAPPFKMELD